MVPDSDTIVVIRIVVFLSSGVMIKLSESHINHHYRMPSISMTMESDELLSVVLSY